MFARESEATGTPAVGPQMIVERAEVEGDPRPDDDGPNPVRSLQIALALVSLVVAALAVVIYIDHRESAAERDAAAAIAAYTEGWNAHDGVAIAAAMAPGASFSAGENLANPLITKTLGSQFDDFVGPLFAADVSLTTIGPVVLVGDNAVRASVPQRFEYDVYGLHVVEEGMSLYSLVKVGGVTRIAQHMWWRPQSPRYPSMLWVGCSSALEPTCK